MTARSPAPDSSNDGHDLLGRIRSRYYGPHSTGDSQRSSHWRLFSEKFSIRVDPSGRLQDLSGYGFGDLQGRGLAFRILAWLGIAAQFVRLRGRVRLIRAILRARPVLKRMGFALTQDAFRQICSLNLLAPVLRETKSETAGKRLRVCVIGDGYGVFTALLKASFPEASVILVDLGQTLLFQAFFLQRAFPDATHRSALDDASNSPAASEFDFFYCPADGLDGLPPGGFDLAVNIASFQEMTTTAIERYFDLLRQRQTKFLYCCNRERKVLPGGEVLEFMEYPWRVDDVHLVSELCPWHQWYVGWERRVGVPVPWVRRYDGAHWHRLTRLSPKPCHRIR